MRAGVLAAAAILAATTTIAADRSGDAGTFRLRPTQPMGHRLVREGLERSLTIRRLVDGIERSDIIVYLELRTDMPTGLVGSLRFIARGTTDRFLQIRLNRRHEWSTLLAFLGHELQHAAEVAATPDVRSADGLRAFYRRAGIRVGPDAYDSRAAQDTGRLVHAELRRGSPVFRGRLASLDKILLGSASIHGR